MKSDVLKKFILDNPDAEILVLTDEDSWTEEYSTEMHNIRSADIEYLSDYDGKLLDSDDVFEQLLEDLQDQQRWLHLNDDEFEEMCKQKIDEMIFKKYIILRLE